MKLLCQLTSDVTPVARRASFRAVPELTKAGPITADQSEKHPYIVCQLKVLLAGQLIVHSLD